MTTTSTHPHPHPSLQQTSAADVTDSDTESEVGLVCLSLGFEQVVDGRFAYARPILLQQADRGLAGVGRQHLLYTENDKEAKINVWGHRDYLMLVYMADHPILVLGT